MPFWAQLSLLSIIGAELLIEGQSFSAQATIFDFLSLLRV
jgi:hypothetical protein